MKTHHRLGVPHTPEAKEKMRQAKLGARHPLYGKSHTPEAKEKMRQAALRRWARVKAKDNAQPNPSPQETAPAPKLTFKTS